MQDILSTDMKPEYYQVPPADFLWKTPGTMNLRKMQSGIEVLQYLLIISSNLTFQNNPFSEANRNSNSIDNIPWKVT